MPAAGLLLAMSSLDLLFVASSFDLISVEVASLDFGVVAGVSLGADCDVLLVGGSATLPAPWLFATSLVSINSFVAPGGVVMVLSVELEPDTFRSAVFVCGLSPGSGTRVLLSVVVFKDGADIV